MMRAGASGYLIKQAAGDVLIGAIRAVAEGGISLAQQWLGDDEEPE